MSQSLSEKYIELAMRTQANQEKIRQRMFILGVDATTLDMASRGLAGDAGEVNTCIQNWLEYGKPLDQNNLLEEVGDCLWRIAQICNVMKWDLDAVMVANIRKLSTRYPDKYTDDLADPSKRNKEAEKKAINDDMKKVGHCKYCQGKIFKIGTDPWKHLDKADNHLPTPVQDGFDIARDIAETYLDGVSLASALRNIDNQEKLVKGGSSK